MHFHIHKEKLETTEERKKLVRKETLIRGYTDERKVSGEQRQGKGKRGKQKRGRK